jgi:carbohydrate kinase (thermoresistant glucokinase family)
MAVVLVLMGVSGSGKSTIGPIVARDLGVPFLDADDFHDAAAVARMRAGLPLDDAMRRPWLERLHGVLAEHADTGVVLACSALRASYRAQLADGVPSVRFVALVAPPEVLAARLRARKGHYAGPALLESQLATLDLDATVLTVDADRPVEQVVADVIRAALNSADDPSADNPSGG